LRDRSSERKLPNPFVEAEIQVLAAYHDYAVALTNSNLVKTGFPASITTSYKEGVGSQFEVKLPPEDDLIVFLHKARPLILNGEHASYNKATGLIGKRLNDPSVRQFLKQQRALYEGCQLRQQFTVVSNNVVLNSEETLQNWLNGFEYHRDQDKRKELEHLHQFFPLEASLALFVMLLSDKALAIVRVANLVRVFIGMEESFHF